MKTYKNRVHMLEQLPKRGIIAEVGVYRGTFAKLIYDYCIPQELHLIDPWEHQEKGRWEDTKRNYNQKKFDGIYNDVVDIFKGEEEVTIYRQYSEDAYINFPDNYFDWIYVDACHMYKCVKTDLSLYFSKVKDDGLILGHDFHVNNKFETGVIRGVNELINTGFVKMVGITLGKASSYVLTKSRKDLSVNESKKIREIRQIKRNTSYFKSLPKNAKILQLGLSSAGVAADIFRNLSPKELHIINTSHDTFVQAEMNKNFGGNSRAHVHNGGLKDMRRKFKNNDFDMLYLDMPNEYGKIKQALELYYATLRDDGVLTGDKYSTTDEDGGAAQAITEFMNDGKLVMTHITDDKGPAFVMRKTD